MRQNKKIFKRRTLLLAVVLLIFSGYYACVEVKSDNKEDQKERTEKFRPQYHFSPPQQWMNDPNGMVYYDGEYHLFYQHYPDSNVWGPMHWGHAISTDMVNWKHMPIALYPDSLGYIFSGSAVIDWKNTSGLGTDENPPMVAMYTYHNIKGEYSGRNDFQTQGIAYSLDKGRSWIKYEKNPVINNPGIRDFRDPKVAWNTDLQKWIMVLAAKDKVMFYSSPDLIDWELVSDFGTNHGAHGGVWECPEIIEFNVEGTNETAWVLLVSINPGGPHGGSATQYFVGDFDGKSFTTNQTETLWLDHGRDNYAGVTWSDIPEEDGRKLFIGWMSNWSYAQVVPTMKWRSAMTIPRELKLQKFDKRYILKSIPVSELEVLRKKEITFSKLIVSDKLLLETEDIKLNCSEMNFKIRLRNAPNADIPDEFGLVLRNNQGEEFKIGFLPEKKKVFIDRTNAGIKAFSEDFAGKYYTDYEIKNRIDLRIFVDESSVEVFVDNGKAVMTNIVFPTIPYNKVELYSNGGVIELKEAKVWGVGSIW